MSIRLALMDMIRRFVAPRGSPYLVEKTYVFILVPFDFRGNGHAKKAEVTQNSISNDSQANSRRTATFSAIIAPESAPAITTPERHLKDEPEPNYDLMWTWFLPNPLGPPKG
jgi:hypothetical protein